MRNNTVYKTRSGCYEKEQIQNKKSCTFGILIAKLKKKSIKEVEEKIKAQKKWNKMSEMENMREKLGNQLKCFNIYLEFQRKQLKPIKLAIK